MAERFDRGLVATVGELADELGLADKRVLPMLELLAGEGWVRRVDGADGRAPGFVLARPASAIELNALLDLAESQTLGSLAETVAGGRVLARLRQGRRELLDGVSVEQAR